MYLEQRKNLDQYSTARLNHFYFNSKVEEKDRVDDFVVFMPFPNTWVRLNTDRKVNISINAARDFLRTYKALPSEVQFAMDNWIQDIQICATQ